jgi:hypothetical protein
MGANYIQALTLPVAEDMRRDTPLVVLEDDVLVAALFRIRLDQILSRIRWTLPPGTQYVLSLYTPYDSVHEWEELTTGVVKYPVSGFYATQGMVFSDATLRANFAKNYQTKCGTDPLVDSGQCYGDDMMIRFFVEDYNNLTEHPGHHRIEFLGLVNALVQHLSKSKDTTVGEESKPHRVPNYIDSRIPCRRGQLSGPHGTS